MNHDSRNIHQNIVHNELRHDTNHKERHNFDKTFLRNAHIYFDFDIEAFFSNVNIYLELFSYELGSVL